MDTQRLQQAEQLLEEALRYLEKFHAGVPTPDCAGCQLKQKLDAWFSRSAPCLGASVVKG